MRGRKCWIALRYKKWVLVACFLVFFIIQLTLPPPPQGFLSWAAPPSCSKLDSPLTVTDRAYCTGNCGDGSCFPRVHGICISAAQVIICDKLLNNVPPFLRFKGERLTIPISHGACLSKQPWISGLSMLADERFLPYKKPNPHHEAEKLIPATFLSEMTNASLYWFCDEDDVSNWAKGFLKAVDMKKKTHFVDLPQKIEEQICFEDAVLFSPPTNVRYVPSVEHNQWLRNRVVHHCSIPIANATQPKHVKIVDRTKGHRHLANKQQVSEMITRILKIPVKLDEVHSNDSFCDQVAKVAMDDLIVVPHGSQNVNLLFARPGATVIEVFPYLFYNDALKNYTHSAGIHMRAVLGMRPPYDMLMWLYSFLGWDACFNLRWCKNYARTQPIYAHLSNMQLLLERIFAIR